MDIRFGYPFFLHLLAILILIIYLYDIKHKNKKMNYKLYQVRDTNGIMQYIFIKMIIANNIVEAEYLFDADMTAGNEYVITITK